MKLWVDAVEPAPNELEYVWMRSLDMAIFSVTLNERKGCPYEGIDIGHVIGTWENIGGVEFLEWLEKTRRNYPVRVHATDPVEKGPMEQIVWRNGWDSLCPDYTPKNTKRLHLTIQCMAVYESGIDVPADMSLEEAIAYAKQHLKDVPLGAMEYVQDSDVLDEENCDFDDYEYGESVEERLADAHVRSTHSEGQGTCKENNFEKE